MTRKINCAILHRKATWTLDIKDFAEQNEKNFKIIVSTITGFINRLG